MDCILIQGTITGLICLIGVYLGTWLTSRHEIRQHQYDFLKQQLTNFYAPLHALRREILSLSEHRVKIEKAAEKSFYDELSLTPDNPGALLEFKNKIAPQFTSVFGYTSEQFKEKIFPKYLQMLEIFRNNVWLAEISTQEYFPLFIEYIEIWDSFLKDKLSKKVISNFGHSEEKLHSLYDDLENNFHILRKRLAKGA